MRRVAHHLQLRRRRQQDVDGCRLAVQPFEVVADAHADVELIARRHHRRHVRRHDEAVTHRGGGLRLADFLRRHRNRHDADLAVEVVRHRVDELLLAADFGNAGPVGHRLVTLAFERVEVEIQPFARIAARRRGQRHQLAELRQDQIQDLRAAHVQFALAEEELQRILQAVTRHLQNALIDGEQRHLLRRIGLDRHRQVFTRLDDRRRRHLEAVLARLGADLERHHAVAQRTHEDLAGVDVAHELHVDVAVALHAGRHADRLHRAGGIAVEPLPGVNFVLLDGDQTAAGIRRVNRHLDLLARLVFRLVQFQLQFGVAIQRTAQVGVAGHAVGDAVERLALRIFNHQHEVARLISRQPQIRALLAQRQRLFRQLHFLHLRLVFVNARILFGQHRNVFLFDQHLLQIRHGDLFQGRIDGDHIQMPLRVAIDVAQIAVGLHPNQIIVRRNQRTGGSRHRTPAAGDERLRQQLQLIGRVGVGFQIERNIGRAMLIGGAIFQLGFEPVAVLPVFVERIIREAIEARIHRPQRHPGGHAAILRRGAEQVLHVDAGLQLRRFYPALLAVRRQRQLHFQLIRFELLHIDRGMAEQRGGIVVFADQIQIDVPLAGR